MNKTAIEYLDYSWNPIAMRCTPTTEGCTNCWHLAMANRLAGNPKIAPEIREAYAGDHEPVLIESRLDEPERRRKSSIIGVQFMGDLFHEAIMFSTISLVMKTVLNCPHHTFVFLTKRPRRMVEYFKLDFPLDNAFVGVTVENNANLWRVVELLKIPDARRFVSYEPALGPIDFLQYMKSDYSYHHGASVIAGCESGPKRRRAQIDWFRSARDQCQEAGVPFFLKQMEVDGKVVSMPELDGKVWKVWKEWPK